MSRGTFRAMTAGIVAGIIVYMLVYLLLKGEMILVLHYILVAIAVAGAYYWGRQDERSLKKEPER